MHLTHDSVFEGAAAVSRFRDGIVAGGLISTVLWAIILGGAFFL